MSYARVTFLYPNPNGTRSIEVIVKDSDTVGDTLPNIITRMNLPSSGPDGKAVRYALDHKESGARLSEDASILEAGVSDGDHLIVYVPREMTNLRSMSTVPLFLMITALLVFGGHFLRSVIGVWQTSLLFFGGTVFFYWVAIRFCAGHALWSDYGFTKSLRDAISDWSNVLVSISMALLIATIVVWFF